VVVQRLSPGVQQATAPISAPRCLGLGREADQCHAERLARLRGLGLFWGSRPLFINGLAEKVFTTRGYWGRWERLLSQCAVVAVAAD